MIFETGQEYHQQFMVDDATYQGFISLFRDRNPLHCDQNFARQKGFEQKVMHGNILNGFISYFIGECLATKEVIIHSQEIEFKLPVYLGDQLNFYAQVASVYESVNVIAFKFNFKNAQAKVVAKGKIQIGLLS